MNDCYMQHVDLITRPTVDELDVACENAGVAVAKLKSVE